MKPIAHASKTLLPAEKNYSQIEKEGLSIMFAVKIFPSFYTWSRVSVADRSQTSNYNLCF